MPCFHCGLPLPETPAPKLVVLGKPREFCCHGCHAVASSIVEAGLDDYYQHRDSPSATGTELEQLLDQLRLYDRAEIQKRFVRSTDSSREATLILERIRCPACLWLNEQHLRQLQGVLDVDMDYTSERATVRWDPEAIQLSEILQAISSIGYIAHPFDPRHRQQLLEDANRRSVERLIIAGVGMMITMQFAFGSYLMGAQAIEESSGNLPLWMVIGRWTNMLVAILLLAWPGQDFFIGAWRDLRQARLGMDVPIALGLSTAFIGSAWGTITQSGEVYYDSIGMFVFFLLLARRIEFRGRRQAASHLDRLALITPEAVQRLVPEHELDHAPGNTSAKPDKGSRNYETVAVIDLQIGDHIHILAGDTLPVDAVLLSAQASVDESLLSGESEPLVYQAGERLIAGAIVIDQAIDVEVLCAANDSTLETLRQLLNKGRQYKPRLAQLADRVSHWFVLVLLALATLTVTTWLIIDPAQALPNTIAVLIVTCPCALALATPVALAIAAAEFSKHGLLALNMSAIETLAEAKHLVLDKTGTLTQGQPRLHQIISSNGFDSSQALSIARAMARESRHPISTALRNSDDAFPDSASAPIADLIDTRTGQGLSASVDGSHWRLGNQQWTKLTDPEAIAALQSATREGQLSVILHRDEPEPINQPGVDQQARGTGSGVPGTPWALFILRDELRSGAQQLLPEMRRLGIRDCTLLSGDRETSVANMAHRLGIPGFRAAQDPQQKLDWIRQRQAGCEQLLMVGDGINDAPTLAAADCSVSFTAATDLAQAHSDFSLLNNDLDALVYARRMARRTQAIIRQNLGWALAYNGLAVPAAMLGWIPPWAAAIGMSVSSLVVVSNSLRLQSKGGNQQYVSRQ